MIKLNRFVEISEDMIGQLQGILSEMAQRIEAAENQIVQMNQAGQQMFDYIQNLDKGFKQSVEDYDFNEFKGKYGEMIGDLDDRTAARYDEGMNFTKDLFNLSRGREDAEAFIKEAIDAVKADIIKAAEGLAIIEETVEGAALEPEAPVSEDVPLSLEDELANLPEEVVEEPVEDLEFERALAAGQI